MNSNSVPWKEPARNYGIWLLKASVLVAIVMAFEILLYGALRYL